MYVYAGYPLIIFVLAQFRQKITDPPETFPYVTLIIAAYQEGSVIGKKIENTLNLDYPSDKFEIIIAVDGNDSTSEVVQIFTDKRVILDHSPVRNGKMAAITRCVKRATGEIIVVSDANNMYDKFTLRALIRPFSNSEVGAVSGSKTVYKDENQLSYSEGLYWKYESFIKKMETRIGSCTAASGEIVAFRKSLYRHPPKRGFSDDFYVITCALRDGYKVVYAPEAKSYEKVSDTPQDEVIRRSKIVALRCLAILNAHIILPLKNPFACWQIISHKFFRTILPLSMMSLYLTNGLIVFFSFFSVAYKIPFMFNFFMVQTVFYLSAAIGSKIKRNTSLGKLFYLPYFIVNSNYAVLLGIIDFMKNGNADLWKKVSRA